MTRVCVYGTLKRGGALHSPLDKSKFLGCARLRGYAMLHLGAFPGIVPSDEEASVPKEKDFVYGEVFEVTDEVLDALDQIEGAPTLYRRNVVRVEPDAETGAEAYDGDGFVETYIYNCSRLALLDSDIAGYDRVASGRWTIPASACFTVEVEDLEENDR